MDVAEKIAQPFAYIHVCKLAAAHEGVDDGGILGGIMVPAEEIPFSSDGQWADTVLEKVIQTVEQPRLSQLYYYPNFFHGFPS